MKVVVAGAGAMGLLIGSYLAESNLSVSFFTRRDSQAEELRVNGVTRILDGESKTVQVNAFSELKDAPEGALWILAVKSKDLSKLIVSIENKAQPAHLLFVQNGLRHFEMGKQSSVSSIGFASLTHGAGKETDTSVIHKGIGVMNLAQLRGDKELTDQLLTVNSPGFPIRLHTDGFRMLLEKAIINCCINPLTAILGKTNGELLQHETSRRLMKAVYNELALVYPETIKRLPFSVIEKVCDSTASNRSSMLIDRTNHVPMEIDTIVSATLGEYRHKMPTLALLEMLLKAIDEGTEST
ncbi:2-dehydropantoate 2-reductase [Sporosarcina aquimarina]|uniref:2-dehydropantoate 2-reductase n=1 Tax=Sporosarcina aquimarina TaxID=114975 RepID=A0ABU4FYZ0_9BACL|nr:2-dehydropantoate 2-reductase [Sporosarcina aquimarina]MDW0109322.1 2-dehydropantoate 2-reductase [Sporosarcina aquimarina]